MANSGEIFFGLVASFAFKRLVLEFLSRRHTREWHNVGSLKELTLFPVKSAKGIEMEEVECASDGLRVITGTGKIVKDRMFVVVTSDMKMITARQKPKLVKIVCQILGDCLHLSAENMPDLSILLEEDEGSERKFQKETIIWGDRAEGVDCGDEASAWLSCYFEVEGYRLLRQSSESLKRCLSSKKSEKWYRGARDIDVVAYQDGFPYMLTSTSSLHDLQRRMGSRKVTNFLGVNSDYFRPNFLVETDYVPFDEDSWAELRVGECEFYNMKPCDRCIMTTIDPDLGQKRMDMEPLKTLRSFRLLFPEFGQSPCFGVNLVLLKSGKVKKGDLVFIKRSSCFGLSGKQEN